MQMEAVHEHITAGFFKVFSELGVTCNGHFNRRILQLNGDLFNHLSYAGVHVDYPVLVGRHCWQALADRIITESPELLFFNTFQKDGIAGWAEQFDRPVIAIVHNPGKFADSEVCMRWARSGRLTVFCLAEHVQKSLLKRVPELEGRVHVHYAYEVLPPGPDEYDADADVLNIVIPGSVNYLNRGFDGLIDTLKETGSALERPVKFSIIAGGPDRKRLEEDISKYGLEKYFELLPLDPLSGRVPHSLYLEALGSCQAIMPLLPASRIDYLKSKVTSGVLAGLGAARPMICPPEVGEAYGFEPINLPTDRPFDISKADLSPATLRDRRQRGLKIREISNKHNREVIERVLADHGLVHKDRVDATAEAEKPRRRWFR